MSLLLLTKFLVISEWIIRLVMLPVVVLRKEKPATSLAWLAIVFFEPWVGLLLYLLIGENRVGRRRLKRRRRLRERFAAYDYPVVAAEHVVDPRLQGEYNLLVHLAEEVGGLPVVGGNGVELMTTPELFISRLIGNIDAAKNHVHLLFYIFRDDEIGRQVSDALMAARQRGVACRVLADGVGSRKLFRRLAPRLRAAGVEILPALPVNLLHLPFARLDHRNHRKLAVIDGLTAYTGSQNIVEATYGHKKAGAWHDIMARITGPVVRQLQGIFVEDWFYETGSMFDGEALTPSCPVAGNTAIQVVPSGPDLPVEQFQDLIVRALFMAQREIVITSPYFIPGEGMLLALRAAARRGVRVVLVVPRRCDHPVVEAAGSFYLQYLTQFGVQVYLYGDGMLHAKTLVIDDAMAMFGSANYDIRSFALNFELNLLLYSAQAVADLHALQLYYIGRSQLATEDDWPTKTLIGRLKVNLAKLASPLL